LDRRNKVRASFGHYVVQDWVYPTSDKTKVEKQTIEFTDMSAFALSHSEMIDNFVYQVFPHPIKYHLVWSTESGSRPFYCWKPVPSSNDFVALGMIGSTSAEEPPAEAVRCFPRAWVQVTKFKPRLLWTDAGAAGGRKGSVWIINSMGMMAVTEGHDAPIGPFYELYSKRFVAAEAPALPFLNSIFKQQQAMAQQMGVASLTTAKGIEEMSTLQRTPSKSAHTSGNVTPTSGRRGTANQRIMYQR
jgi:hypothetical protein